ncbi:MAG: multidrug effflux MFS transporter [Hyphomonadaceae bacterium]
MPDSSTETPPAEAARPAISQAEFIVMAALLMATNAMAIDIMLPALADIGSTFNLTSENDRQLVVVAYMMGFGVSQLFYGPITDRFGRRRVLFVSLVCYAITSAACAFAPSFETLILARVLQGTAAGGSRVIAVSAARDLYAGRRMAKVMSLVMIVFMAAPILAPSIGQLVLIFTDWRGIFWALVAFSMVMLVWVFLRLPETLPPDRRNSLDLKVIGANYLKVLTTRESCGYMIASGMLFSGLMSYISSSEQLYHEVYHTGDAFPLWFAGAALAMSCSNIINSRLVERLGMRRMSHGALLAFVVVSAVHALLALNGLAPFPVFYTLIILTFFAIGFQGPNYNAIAMEPLGRLAGSGAALIGFASSFVAALVGGFIAQHFDGTTTPIFIGHALVGLGALTAVLVTERGRLFQSGTPS